MNAKQIPLFFLQCLLFADESDLVVRHLLQLFSAVLVGQFKVIRQLLYFAGHFSQNVLTVANRAMKHADAQQAAVIDIRVYRTRRNHIVNSDALAGLTISVDAPNALLNAHGVPWQIIVNHAIAKLIIQAFTAYFGEQKYVEGIGHRGRCFRRVKSSAERPALLIRNIPMDHANSIAAF